MDREQRRQLLKQRLNKKPGLGDYVAKGLSAIGITKERVSKVTGKPCRCGERQKAMNKWGEKWLGIGGKPPENA